MAARSSSSPAPPPTDLVPLAARLDAVRDVVRDALPAAEELPARSPVRPGDALEGRYRLTAPLPVPGGAAVVWHAVDELLDRDVAVAVLPVRSRGGTPSPGGRAFLDAAARTGALLAPGLLRTLDASVEEREGRDGEPRPVAAHAVWEWPEGRLLPDLLADGPLPAVEAVAVADGIADALRAAHAAGLAHGRLTPGCVLVGVDGRVRLWGTGLSALLHGAPAEADAEQARAEDARALGRVLYALLTARWPGDVDQADGLAPAPHVDGRLLSPRQVRAGVPRGLDSVVRGALGGPGATPGVEALAASAREAVAERVEVREQARRRRVPPLARRSLPWVLSLALLAVAGLVGFRTGLDVGDLDAPDDPLQAVVAPGEELPEGSGPAVLDLTAAGVSVRSYDPGGDGLESPGEVPNAFDGDITTAWTTEGYRTTGFGGLKDGVGLLVDLGERTGLARVEVDLRQGGADVEVRAGDDAARLVTVAREEGVSERAVLNPRGTARGRYWALWFTRLPDGGAVDSRASVVELRLVQAG